MQKNIFFTLLLSSSLFLQASDMGRGVTSHQSSVTPIAKALNTQQQTQPKTQLTRISRQDVLALQQAIAHFIPLMPIGYGVQYTIKENYSFVFKQLARGLGFDCQPRITISPGMRGQPPITISISTTANPVVNPKQTTAAVAATLAAQRTEPQQLKIEKLKIEENTQSKIIAAEEQGKFNGLQEFFTAFKDEKTNLETAQKRFNSNKEQLEKARQELNDEKTNIEKEYLAKKKNQDRYYQAIATKLAEEKAKLAEEKATLAPYC